MVLQNDSIQQFNYKIKGIETQWINIKNKNNWGNFDVTGIIWFLTTTTNFPHNIFSVDTQIENILKHFSNNSAGSSKKQTSKIVELGELLGKYLSLLFNTGSTLAKNIFKPLDRSAPILLRLAATASSRDASIQKKVSLNKKPKTPTLKEPCSRTLISRISSKQIECTMNIVNPFNTWEISLKV